VTVGQTKTIEYPLGLDPRVARAGSDNPGIAKVTFEKVFKAGTNVMVVEITGVKPGNTEVTVILPKPFGQVTRKTLTVTVCP